MQFCTIHKVKRLFALGIYVLVVPLGAALAQQMPAAPATRVAADAEIKAGLGLEDAIRLMLASDPNLTLEQARLRATQGALLTSRGAFDPVLSTRAAQQDTRSPLSEDTSRKRLIVTNGVGVTQQFRTGTSISPGFELERTTDPGIDPVNLGTFSFQIRQPLLQGLGRAATAAPEMSAERELAASRLDLRQTTDDRLLEVATRYWEARAAVLNLDILRASEESSRGLLDTTRKLIDADVTPAAELVQVEANVVAKETSRIGGEQALFEARQALGREIGLERASIAKLPLPSDPFPVLPPSAVPPPAEGDRLIAAALDHRADLQAARERVNAADIAVTAAINATRPKLDLIFTPSYSGFVQGRAPDNFFSPLFQNVPGASTELSLALSWPTLNREAEGLRAQAEAIREQNAIAVDIISRRIGADVPTALEVVASSALQLDRATEAVRLFEQAVINEEKKLRAGTSTLLDVITQRDRLTAARQSQVSANLTLAVALARLRFETGTLGEAVADATTIRPDRVTTLPLQGGKETTP